MWMMGRRRDGRLGFGVCGRVVRDKKRRRRKKKKTKLTRLKKMQLRRMTLETISTTLRKVERAMRISETLMRRMMSLCLHNLLLPNYPLLPISSKAL
jgi:hypothetical protein